MISDLANQMPVYNALKNKVAEHLECKICKCVPPSSATVVVTSCCNQYFGCKSCYERAVSSEVSCPLCRSTEVSAIPLKGFDGLFADLSSQHQQDRSLTHVIAACYHLSLTHIYPVNSFCRLYHQFIPGVISSHCTSCLCSPSDFICTPFADCMYHQFPGVISFHCTLCLCSPSDFICIRIHKVAATCGPRIVEDRGTVGRT